MGGFIDDSQFTIDDLGTMNGRDGDLPESKRFGRKNVNIDGRGQFNGGHGRAKLSVSSASASGSPLARRKDLGIMATRPPDSDVYYAMAAEKPSSNYIQTWKELEWAFKPKSATAVLALIADKPSGDAFVLDLMKSLDFSIQELSPILDALKNSGAIELGDAGIEQRVKITEVGRKLVQLL